MYCEVSNSSSMTRQRKALPFYIGVAGTAQARTVYPPIHHGDSLKYNGTLPSGNKSRLFRPPARATRAARAG
jgi:hypothetical protein